LHGGLVNLSLIHVSLNYTTRFLIPEAQRFCFALGRELYTVGLQHRVA
jgi:hypothetical protein